MFRTGAVLTILVIGAASRALADGPYYADSPGSYLGSAVDNGHCVKFVQAAANAPQVAEWSPGDWVRGNLGLMPHTAIATFEVNGTYTAETGNHAAIYIAQDVMGIWVYDQWKGQPVHRRLIRFEGGKGKNKGSKSNDGTLYRVIE